MNKRTRIKLRVSEQAEQFYEKSQELGKMAAEAFSKVKEQQHRSQMTGLENIAETTMKTTDVLDYIKKQMARQYKNERERNKGWTQDFKGQSFGESLKSYIEVDLKKAVDKVCESVGEIGNTTEEDKRDRQLIYLLLIRQFIRQVVVQYEYESEYVSKIHERQTR